MPVGTRPKRGNTADKAYAAEARLNDLGLYSDGNDIDRYGGTTAPTADGNPYSVGIYSQFLTAAVAVNSTTPTTLWSFGVAAGANYRMRGLVVATEGATASQVRFQFNGPTFSNVRINIKLFGGPLDGSPLTPFLDHWVNMNTPSDPVPKGNNIPANGAFCVELDGVFHNASATGTVNVMGGENTGGDPWTASAWSWLDVWPM